MQIVLGKEVMKYTGKSVGIMLLTVLLIACNAADPVVSDKDLFSALYLQSTAVPTFQVCEGSLPVDEGIRRYNAMQRGDYDMAALIGEAVATNAAMCAIEMNRDEKGAWKPYSYSTLQAGLDLSNYIDAEVNRYKKGDLPPKVILSAKRALLMLSHAETHKSDNTYLQNQEDLYKIGLDKQKKLKELVRKYQ